jgi:hypothetical protein
LKKLEQLSNDMTAKEAMFSTDIINYAVEDFEGKPPNVTQA